MDLKGLRVLIPRIDDADGPSLSFLRDHSGPISGAEKSIPSMVADLRVVFLPAAQSALALFNDDTRRAPTRRESVRTVSASMTGSLTPCGSGICFRSPVAGQVG
jgi:hypothetical protein